VLVELPEGTVTFLFTDVEGSTRLLDELGPVRYAEALERHRDVIRAALAATPEARQARSEARSSTPSG
jgi:class 3 adenylate cyclase